MSNTSISADELADLLMKTGKAHHAAYEATNGADPEWPSWYSGHLQTLLGNRLGRSITRSEIVYLLWKAEKDRVSTRSAQPWTVHYARLILGETQ